MFPKPHGPASSNKEKNLKTNKHKIYLPVNMHRIS